MNNNFKECKEFGIYSTQYVVQVRTRSMYWQRDKVFSSLNNAEARFKKLVSGSLPTDRNEFRVLKEIFKKHTHTEVMVCDKSMGVRYE